jgi:PAP2 superfamily
VGDTLEITNTPTPIRRPKLVFDQSRQPHETWRVELAISVTVPPEKKTNIEALRNRLLVGALVCAVLLIVGYFVLVATPWGHQFDDQAFFGRKALSRKVIVWDYHMLARVSKRGLLCAAILLIIIGVARRCTLVGAIAAAGFGSAVLGAEFLKKMFPWHVLVADDRLLSREFRAGSYPSGHATIGTSLALGLLMVSSSRWRPWLAVAAGCFSATFSTGVLFAGWHRPSDALGALAWSGFCMSLAAAIAVRLRGGPRPAIPHAHRALFGSVGLGILVAAGTWYIAAQTASEYPHGDVPFFVVTGLIITGSFSLLAWYGWQLRAIDWPPTDLYGLKSKLNSTSRRPASPITTPGSE